MQLFASTIVEVAILIASVVLAATSVIGAAFSVLLSQRKRFHEWQEEQQSGQASLGDGSSSGESGDVAAKLARDG